MTLPAGPVVTQHGLLTMNEDAQTAVPSDPGPGERAWELLQAGGPVAVILVIMSIVALTIVIAKLLQFRSLRVADRRTAEQGLALWRQQQPDEALARVSAARSPVAQALARVIRGAQRGLSEHRVREEVVRYGSDVLERLRGGFRALELIGSLAPLLGLFGTVLGMIEAFQQLQNAGNQVNPAVLSGGIWQALLTTAVGLGVAIPVVALHTWLERRVDALAHAMDDVVTRAYTEDLSSSAPAPAREATPRDSHTRSRHDRAGLRAAAATGD